MDISMASGLSKEPATHGAVEGHTDVWHDSAEDFADDSAGHMFAEAQEAAQADAAAAFAAATVVYNALTASGASPADAALQQMFGVSVHAIQL
jgi:hypothetical protein